MDSKGRSEGNFMSKFTNANMSALKHLTSRQFFEVWSNYDQDGNGYIEGRELDNFLREFVTSIHNDDNEANEQARQEPLDEELLKELKEAFMDAYDNNRDGRIDIRELAQLLPIEESFKLLFKFENQCDSSVEFMRIWNKYDTDSSGSIDSNELRNFLRDLISTNHQVAGSGNKIRKSTSVEEDKLDEYTETLLKIFDTNRDGKLQLNEMTNNKKLDKQDIKRIFKSYDRDGNGVIENEELKGFMKDLMDFLGKVPDTKDIEDFERMVMDGCDANNDGKISEKELTTVLLALAKHACEQEANKRASPAK